jgi:hypothetical protein
VTKSKIGMFVRYVFIGAILSLLATQMFMQKNKSDKLLLELIFMAFSCITSWLIYIYILDLIQYPREGWNFDERTTRADMRWSENGNGPQMSTKTQMWFGYPMFILTFGGFSIAAGLDVFGVVQLFE